MLKQDSKIPVNINELEPNTLTEALENQQESINFKGDLKTILEITKVVNDVANLINSEFQRTTKNELKNNFEINRITIANDNSKRCAKTCQPTKPYYKL